MASFFYFTGGLRARYCLVSSMHILPGIVFIVQLFLQFFLNLFLIENKRLKLIQTDAKKLPVQVDLPNNCLGCLL